MATYLIKTYWVLYVIKPSEVNSLPNSPGCYLFGDGKGTVLYVGKAKNLKKRVSSYFVKINSISGKVQMLVRKILYLL